MPSALTYPGVYVEEVPSGVRTIVGVPTSITAFLGRAERGPTAAKDGGTGTVTVFSFDEYEREFGGLSVNFPMSFTLRDFFQNGGTQAVIARYVHKKKQDGQEREAAASTDDPLKLAASSEGAWGDRLWISRLDVVDDAETRARYGLDRDKTKPPKLYNLEVVEREFLFDRQVPDPDDATKKITQHIYRVVRTESINGVVFLKDSPSPRRIDRVLPSESRLVVATGLPDKEPESLGFIDPTGRTVFDKPPTQPQPPPDGGQPAQPPPNPRVFIRGDDGEPSLVATDFGDFKDRFDRVDLFNIMCLSPNAIDGDVDVNLWQKALDYCVKRRAMLIVDPPAAWKEYSDASHKLDDLGIGGTDARNAALYFPRVKQANPLRDNAIETFVPCGIVAGQMARTDVTRGVWKAPAGIDVNLGGTRGLQVELTDEQNGVLNPLGINCLRSFPIYGRVVWGARTLRGADRLADEYKYVPVRRLALYIEESLFRGTKWVVFEPNGEILWAQIRSNVGAFMQNLFRQGAFAGSTPQQAYFVNCDKTTNPQILVDQGVVTIKVGFAPLKPAEFVVIQLTQIAGTPTT